MSERPDPQTEAEWTIHSLNIHGTFFERWCQKVVAKAPGWDLLKANVPVAFPPMGGQEGELDIWAMRSSSRHRLSLLIECKKNNPDFVDWVFFPKPQFDADPGANLLPRMPVHKLTNTPYPSSGWWVDRSYEVSVPRVVLASEARETRGTYLGSKRGDLTKTSNAAVTDAAKQITLATHAIVEREIQHSEGQGRLEPTPGMEWSDQRFVPMIVTTAQLSVCEFDPDDIAADTGTIPFDKVNLTVQPALIFEYPIPTSLQIDPDWMTSSPSHPSTGIDDEWLTRMPIVVVNSNHFAQFLDELTVELGLA